LSIGRRRWAIVSLRRTLRAVVGLLRAVPKANITPLSPGRKCPCSCAGSNARLVAGKSLAVDHWTTVRTGETLGATRSEIKSSKERYVPLPQATPKLTAGHRRPFSRSWPPNVGLADQTSPPVTLFMAFDRVGRRNAVIRRASRNGDGPFRWRCHGASVSPQYAGQ
jgi:hypothetical protein